MYRIDGCSIEATKSCQFRSHIVLKEKEKEKNWPEEKDFEEKSSKYRIDTSINQYAKNYLLLLFTKVLMAPDQT